MTLVGYFNALRELAAMRRAVDDTVSTRLKKMPRRGLPQRYLDVLNVRELTSRLNAGDIPDMLDRLETPFDGIPKAERKGKRRPSEFPIDVLLATNMISVGVDVERLGLMVVGGQPKSTAEYIQATSRVGRRHPGLVAVVYNWTRPRDMSHYERFRQYHATFYQHVEALSVTPFSPRALDRGLSGVLVALARLSNATYNPNFGAAQLAPVNPTLQVLLRDIVRRAEVVSTTPGELVRRALEERLDHWRSRISASVSVKLGYQKAGPDSVALLAQPSDSDWDLFTCLNSLRDVEPTVNLVLDDGNMDSVGQGWYYTTATATAEATASADEE